MSLHLSFSHLAVQDHYLASWLVYLHSDQLVNASLEQQINALLLAGGELSRKLVQIIGFALIEMGQYG